MIKRVDENGNVRLITNIRKPRKWRRYEYLLSSGTLGIDLGIPGNIEGNKYKIGIVIEGNSSQTSGIIGTHNTNTPYNRSYIGVATNNNFEFGYGDNYPRDFAYTKGTKYDIEMDSTNNRYIAKINGIIAKDVLFTGNKATSNIYIGWVHQKSANYSFRGKIYYAQVYSNNTLIKDLVPAQYNGLYGMWDLIEDKFYGNSGTGSFTVGPEIKNYDEIYEVRRTGSILPAGVELYDYILSSGTLWIDSGVLLINGNILLVELEGNYVNTYSTLDYTFGWDYGGLIGRSSNTGWTQDSNTTTSNVSTTIKTNIILTINTVNHISECTYKNSGSSEIKQRNNSNIMTYATVGYPLFRAKNKENFYGSSTAFKLYSCKIHRDGILVRDFVPCTYLGEPGMWDTVENKFYRNQGTGLFTLGNKITLKEYEYLATTGSLSINNNIILTEGHTLTYDIIFKYDATGVRRLMGPSGNASAYFGVNASNKYEKVSSADNIPVGNIDHIYEHFDAINGKITRQLNNMLPYILDHAIDKMVNYPTFIFALVNATSYTGSGQYFYSGKILYDGKVARDYIPCSYNGTPGLWDKVEWKFYANAGSGSFTLGPEKASGIYPVWRNVTIEDTFTFKLTPKVKRNIATLLGIKGNSIAWNLLISESYPNTYHTNRTNNSDGSFTATPSDTGTYSLYYPTTYSLILVNSTHRYYMSSYIKSDNGLLIFGLIYYSGSGPHTGYNILITPTTSLQRYAFVTTTNVVSGRLLGIATCASNIPTSFTIKNFMCIDLTLIYGARNEPTTVALFEADYYKWFGKSLTYEVYDEGSLRSTKCTELKSVGFNQQSENMELGRYALDTGIKYNLNNCIRISNPIKVFPNTNYYIHNPYVNNNYYLWVLYLDNDDKLIEKINGNNNYIGPENVITTTPINASKLIFYIYGTTNYYNDVCINLSNSKLNGTYKPYNSQTISIPVTSITGKLNGSGNSVVIFPDGMKSTGDRWDEIYVENGVTKAIKRIGSIDMGSANHLVLRDNFSTTGNCYINGFGSAEGISGIRLVTCSKFSSMPTYSNLISSMSEYVAAEKGYKTVNFRVKDHTLTKEQVKEYITGTILYYELEVYLEYIVDNFTLPQYFGVELGGTEEIKSDTISVAPTLLINYKI